MRTLEFTKEMVKEYYEQQYALDLQNYFKLQNGVDHNSILDLDTRNNYVDGNPSGFSSMFGGHASTEKNFIFAGLFLYMIIMQQSLYKLFGDDVQNQFHRCTGWPWISAGMAGPYYSSYAMMQEATLCPNNVEYANFVRMLDIVFDFMNKEISDFLTRKNPANLNQDDYQSLTNKVSCRTEDILTLVAEGKKEFVSLLQHE